MIKQFILSVAAILLLTVGVTAQEKYAVLITGDYAAKGIPQSEQYNDGIGKGNKGFDEFWHDTFLMWEMLLKKGYSQENIIVLFADGTDFYNTPEGSYIADRYRPGIDTIVTDYAATRANVYSVLEGLATGSNGFPKVKQEDFLFVWTFDHGGGSNGNSYLCLLDGNLTDVEFASLTNQIDAHKKVFWMQQCRSGGFVDNLQGDDTFIITA